MATSTCFVDLLLGSDSEIIYILAHKYVITLSVVI